MLAYLTIIDYENYASIRQRFEKFNKELLKGVLMGVKVEMWKVLDDLLSVVNDLYS